jgi:hypothetical protein
MKTDLYTKVMLTIIAFSLVWIPIVVIMVLTGIIR